MLKNIIIIIFFYFTILYWFCNTSTCIRHRCTHVPHHEPPSHLPPHTIPLGHPSAPAPSILCYGSNLDWRFVSHMILYMFQCHSPKSSHPLPLPQSKSLFYRSVSLLLSHIQGYYSVQFSSVTRSCPTLCDPMNHSTQGLPVHHQLPEFTQTHIHRVSAAMYPSHPLLSPSPPAPNPSQHQSLLQ